MQRMGYLIAAAVVCMSLDTPARAEEPASSTSYREDRLKAGYLFNFAKFVDWPPTTAPDLLTICFVGGNGVRNSLSSDAADKRIGARRILLRSLRHTDAPTGCNVIYLDDKLPPAVRPAFCSLPLPILTVSDAPAFTSEGGMIALYTEKNRLRFVVNVQNTQRVGLQISSNLLQLASAVEKGGAQ